MASMVNDPGGCKRILFVAPDGKRKAIRLGKASMKQAEAFKVKVQGLIGQSITGALDDEVSRWVAGLDDRIHARLARAGLVDNTQAQHLPKDTSRYEMLQVSRLGAVGFEPTKA